MPENRPFKKPSIRDVARQAEVSVTTVSHVASGVGGYSDETVRKVKRVIEELNYVPSYATNALKRVATKTIGVCASDRYSTPSPDKWAFSDRLWSGIIEEADKRGYKVLHFPKVIRESQLASEFLNGQIDGLLICCEWDDPRPTQVAKAGLPVVTMARAYEVPEGVAAVTVDEHFVVCAGLNHLASHGHTSISYIAGPAHDVLDEQGQARVRDDIARARLDAYCSWMRKNLPHCTPRWFATEDWSPGDLTDNLRLWITEGAPSAILAANDTVARRAIEAATRMGLRVPEDISILGIDNNPDQVEFEPRLSSVDVPFQEIGRYSVRVLIDLLKGGNASQHLIDLPTLEVIQRTSTGPRPTTYPH